MFEQYNTQEIWQKDIDHVIHPWAAYPNFESEGALVIAESQGVHIFDSDGKKYLDESAGFGA